MTHPNERASSTSSADTSLRERDPVSSCANRSSVRQALVSAPRSRHRVRPTPRAPAGGGESFAPLSRCLERMVSDHPLCRLIPTSDSVNPVNTVSLAGISGRRLSCLRPARRKELRAQGVAAFVIAAPIRRASQGRTPGGLPGASDAGAHFTPSESELSLVRTWTSEVRGGRTSSTSRQIVSDGVPTS